MYFEMFICKLKLDSFLESTKHVTGCMKMFENESVQKIISFILSGMFKPIEKAMKEKNRAPTGLKLRMKK